MENKKSTFTVGLIFLALAIVVLILCSVEISSLNDWEDITAQSMKNAITIFALTITLIVLLIFFSCFDMCLEGDCIWKVKLGISIFFMCGFIALTISTICATTNDWLPSEMTPEVVESRIQSERELECCYYRVKVKRLRLIARTYGVTVYGDCPYVVNQTLAVDQASCEKHDATSVCLVEKDDMDSDYICDDKFVESQAIVIWTYVLEMGTGFCR